MTREQAKDFKWFASDRQDIYAHIDKIFDELESRCCESCKFWNTPSVAEIYGVDVCSQYHKAKFNQKDRALVKIRTEADFCCNRWESRDE